MACSYNPCKNQAEIMCDCNGCVYLCQNHIKNHTNDNISIVHDSGALYLQIWKANYETEQIVPKRKSDYKQEPEAFESKSIIRNFKPKRVSNNTLISFQYKRHQKSHKFSNLTLEEHAQINLSISNFQTAFSDTHLITMSYNNASFYNQSDFSLEKSVNLQNVYNFQLGKTVISPNNKWVAKETHCWRPGGNRSIEIYDLIDGKSYVQFLVNNLHSLEFSSCSNYLAAGIHENEVMVYSIKTREVICRFKALQGNIFSLDWHKDYLFCGGKNCLFKIWDIKNQLLIYQSKDTEYLSIKSHWSRDCKFVIIGNNKGEILKLNTVSRKLIKHQAHVSNICDLKWGHNDQFIFLTGDWFLKIFDSKNLNVLYNFKAEPLIVYIAISPNGSYLTYSTGLLSQPIYKLTYS